MIVTFSENPFIKILKHSQFFRESDLIVIENKDEVLYSTLSETQLAERLCGKETGDTIQIDGISHIVVEEKDELVAMTYLWLIPEERDLSECGLKCAGGAPNRNHVICRFYYDGGLFGIS